MKRLQRRDKIRQEIEQESEAANATPSDLPIAELGLNTRFENILAEAGINTVQDVLNVLNESGDDGILDISGLGNQALLEIKKSLRQQGHEVELTEA
ncbi:MAG: DNA-directed RNA polymerase subunit alpha C-terminal domain-containing protein [Chloroflexota bacterium]